MRNQRNGERGVALLLTMFTLMIITAIGFSMMFQTDTETAINANFRDQQTGYYAAAAGLEEARDRMRSNAPAAISGSVPTVLPGSANGALYIINSAAGETIQPWSTADDYFDGEICLELNCFGSLVPPTVGWYTSSAASTAYSASPLIPYKWTRINLKKNGSAVGTANTMYVNGGVLGTSDYYVCWNGTNEFASLTPCATPHLPVYLLTTLAVTPSGTRRMLQYELTRSSRDLVFPAALTILGPTATTNMASSNNYVVDGNDHAGCGGPATGSPVLAVGVSNSSVDTSVTDSIPNNRLDHYTGSGTPAPPSPITTPDVQVVSSLPAEFQSVSSLEALMAQIKGKADQVYATNQTSLSNPGTSSSPQVIFVDGDLTLSGNVTGYGILAVTGTYNPSGSVGWRGIVLVVGEGEVTGGGGGNNTYDGVFIVAKTRDNGTVLSTLGTPTYDWDGGGGNGIRYSTGCLKQANDTTPYQVLSSRELLY